MEMRFDRASNAMRRLGFRAIPLLACLAILAGCATAPGTSMPEHRRIGDVIIVDLDLGGNIGRRTSEMDAIRGAGQRVEIRGICASACTMYLGLESTCVSRGARLRFHGPSFPGRKLSKPAFDTMSGLMAAAYPEPLRGWFMAQGRHRIRGYHTVRGAELIGMGVRECADGEDAKRA